MLRVLSMSRLTPREALVEEELYHLIRVVLDKHGSILNGVKFGKVQPQHPVDGGVADLVLPFADGKHLLVIECKRKITKPSGIQTIRDFDIFGSNVLNQALNYAVRLGTLCFATTNGSRLALFRTPKAGEPFRIDTHRLMVQDPFKLEEKNVEEFLGFLSKWHAGVPVRLVEIDWFFISRLRSFVDFLSKSFKPVIERLAFDKVTSKKFEDFSKKVGGVTKEQLARETAYLLMNKVIFYKILERHYEGLPKLKPISAPDGKYFIEFLKGYFEKAIQVTGDFEPIFITEFYDGIPLSDVDYVWDEVNSFIEEMDTYRLEEIGSDVVGYIYEELIPEEERHRLGQFYTPPPIAELIVKWAVRSSKDVILDPAVGSGTFLVKAYQRLMELKAKERKKPKEPADIGVIHKEILSQLYADDINPFPAHLTSMNLAMRNVQHPTSEMNIIVEDFFNLRSRMNVFTSYVMKTPKGEVRRHVTIPTFDAVIANPPYTRGVEITDKTQKSINISIGELLKRYKLSGGIGKETGIYVHLMMHALEFLKKHGRLGMIVSNSWLQSDYGINFDNFLLDHFKVKAVIDFNQRLFRVPLVATCVLLLEKEKNPNERSKNKTIFLYVNAEARVDEILDALDNPEEWKAKFLINVVKQGDLPRDQKWIKKFFDTDEIEAAILDSPLITLTTALFEPRYGNILGVTARGGTGADRFFYQSKQDVKKWNIPNAYLSPVLVRSRYSKSFTFTQDDWIKLKNTRKPCYAFICHKPKNSLPKTVREFIQWGERTELVRVKLGEEPKTAIQSMASMTRENDRKHFYGWYDLGGVLKAPVFASRRAQYHHRFVMSKNPDIAIDDGFITFIPREKLSEKQLEAVLACLNSDIGRFFVEIYGRSTGGGVIELDDKSAGKIPTLNCREISEKETDVLGGLFNRLETETRLVGEAETQESLAKLQPILDEIDVKIAEILELKIVLLQKIKEIVRFFFERRVSRTEKASPESVKGEEEPRITPPRKMKKQQKAMTDKQLTRWIE
jgi:type I restriction-modification system DNA methylase subunit